ncbi:MAG: hypothetical protein A07HN63_00753 [uncultured archaeon A07HN63]|nr:MAG: hypothetical protein A07HN63_00753 [uncultured archaeon A07HN63]
MAGPPLVLGTVPETLPIGGIDFLSVGSVVFSAVAALGYGLVTLLVGTFLVTRREGPLREIDATVQAEPLRSLFWGLVAMAILITGYLLVGVTVGVLVELGAPPQVNGLLLLAILVGVLILVVATAAGRFVAGSFLVRRVSDDPPNRWLALGAGVVLLGVAGLLPLISLAGPVATLLAVGGIVGRALDDADVRLWDDYVAHRVERVDSQLWDQ